jgi:hypothetical protein
VVLAGEPPNEIGLALTLRSPGWCKLCLCCAVEARDAGSGQTDPAHQASRRGQVAIAPER